MITLEDWGSVDFEKTIAMILEYSRKDGFY